MGQALTHCGKCKNSLAVGFQLGYKVSRRECLQTSCLTSFHAGSLSYRSVRVSVSLQVSMPLCTLQSQPPSLQVVICCISNLEENKQIRKQKKPQTYQKNLQSWDPAVLERPEALVFYPIVTSEHPFVSQNHLSPRSLSNTAPARGSYQLLQNLSNASKKSTLSTHIIPFHKRTAVIFTYFSPEWRLSISYFKKLLSKAAA